MRDLRPIALAVIVSLAPTPLFSLGHNKGLYVGGSAASLPSQVEGKAILDEPDDFVFLGDKESMRLVIPYGAVESIEYGQHAARRTKAAAVQPLALFTRSRKHFVTLTYKTASGDQTAAFEFGKSVIRLVLATLKAKSGKPLKCQDGDAVKQMGGTCDVLLPSEIE